MPSHNDYTVGWVCSSSAYLSIATAMLDRVHSLPKLSHRKIQFVFGEILGRNVVTIAHTLHDKSRLMQVLPLIFPNVRFWLIVGVGGGVPRKDPKKHGIRLGDVAVGDEGVMEYFSRYSAYGEILTYYGRLCTPPSSIRDVIANISQSPSLYDQRTFEIASKAMKDNSWLSSQCEYPGVEKDELPDLPVGYDLLKDLPIEHHMKRAGPIRRSRIHYGKIASSKLALRNGRNRDTVARRFEIICFDDDDIGIKHYMPRLVIRGICDYCDPHWNPTWQGYAFLMAAAYTRMLTSVLPQGDSDSNVRIPSSVSTAREMDTKGVPSAPLTDSGYASNVYGTPKTASKSIGDQVSRSNWAATRINESFEEEAVIYETERDRSISQTNDANSIYTGRPDDLSLRREAFISEIAQDIIAKASLYPNEKVLHDLIPSLPRHLKAFASKVGHLGSTQMHRDVMVFIRKHRVNIADRIREKLEEEDEDIVKKIRPQFLLPDVGDMGLDDRMNLWYARTVPPEISNNYGMQHGMAQSLDAECKVRAPSWAGAEELGEEEACSSIADGGEPPQLPESFLKPKEVRHDNIPELAQYKDLITNTPVYHWLLKNIQKEILLARPEPDVQSAIREKILEAIPVTDVISRSAPPEICEVTFTLEWNPLKFFREQGYENRKDRLAEKVITITGSTTNAQAVTCLQYLSQTWPYIGPLLLDFLQAAFEYADSPSRVTLPDRTEVKACMGEPICKITAVGGKDSVAEIGELLSWLGAALRSSPTDSVMATCTPTIAKVTRGTVIPTEANLVRVSCTIGFDYGEVIRSNGPSNGQCWYGLFKNPVVVQGFPVPRRPVLNTGLEIPLNIMVGLMRREEIEPFNNRLFIKGFSTILVPIDHKDNITIWHLLYMADRGRVSFLDGEELAPAAVTMSDLEKGRHVVGWCVDAKCYAGAMNAKYSIDRSWLRWCHSGCMLNDVEIKLPKPVVGGFATVYGDKDTPVRILVDDYIESLRWLSKRYSVLWDVESKRGWLVNGASALLHLLYASFEFSKNDGFHSAFCLKWEHWKDAKTPYTSASALEVLLNYDNLNLKIYDRTDPFPESDPIAPVTTGTESAIRVRDIVRRLLGILEKIFDHQLHIMGGNSKPPNQSSRKHLEGWDFKDLATFEEPLCPRVYRLGAKGKSWVDFTRSINAVTLFGRGFGEIIEPVSTLPGVCPRWTTLPGGNSNLAVCVFDLYNIADRLGNPHTNPIRLTKSTLWYNVDYDTCQCTNGPQLEPCELTEVLLPTYMRKGLPGKHKVAISSRARGAVVFGYNRRLPWFWGNTGPPESCEAPSYPTESESESESEYEDEFHDTGIGSSVHLLMTDADKPPTPVFTTKDTQELTHKDYEVGIVCALWKELLAVRALFDNIHQELRTVNRDPNHYSLGKMKGYNVVAAGLPSDDYGTNSATNVTSHLIRSFPGVKFCLVVGVGGGVPSHAQDIRLGDVVISTAVVQFDMGKAIQGAPLKMAGNIQKPPGFLMSAITGIRGNPLLKFDGHSSPLNDHLDHIINIRPDYQRPHASTDLLFGSDALHINGNPTCEHCEGTPRARPRRPHDGPNIHYGLIASGNQVIRDVHFRDRLGAEHGALCFEMESAGVMSTFPCLVIRGICDYADSHKNRCWQEYASATAAAYAKLFLTHLRLGYDME